jgi:iron complex transport system substrate-binding protein
MPSVPFPFCDRPPGLNRFLGIQWLANLFYPDYFDVDMAEVVREFYDTCYWRTLDREEALNILAIG